MTKFQQIRVLVFRISTVVGMIFAIQSCTSTHNISSVSFEQLEALGTDSKKELISFDDRLPIIQGPTSATATQFAVLHKKNSPMTIMVRKSNVAGNAWSAPQKSFLMSGENSQEALTQFFFEGLETGQNYELVVLDEQKKIADWRKFKTLNPNAKKAKVLVASCLDDRYPDLAKQMWNEAQNRHADFILLIGDNVYADSRSLGKGGTDPEMLWARYAETRKLLGVFRWTELVPIIATWDDHDYGANDGDRTYVFREKSEKIFEAFFPQQTIPNVFIRGVGVSSVFRMFGQQWILTDDRSFRSPANATDETHWGEGQTRWVLDLMRGDRNPTWLIEGDQFFGGYHKFESFEGNHPNQFSSLLKQLRNLNSPVVFVSGDRHLAELMKIDKEVLGFETYEVTTSGMHAKMFPGAWDKNKNPRQIEGVSGVANYAVIESNPTSLGGVEFSVSIYGPSDKELFTRRLAVEE